MTRRSARIAAAAVRGWTRLYTWRLPAEERRARRAEIESDLWEQLEGDPRQSPGAMTILARLTLWRRRRGEGDDQDDRNADTSEDQPTVTAVSSPDAAVREMIFLEDGMLVIEGVRKLTPGTINTRSRYRRER